MNKKRDYHVRCLAYTVAFVMAVGIRVALARWFPLTIGTPLACLFVWIVFAARMKQWGRDL